MRIVFKSEAPGSSGELELELDSDELHFIEVFVLLFNDANPDHAQPTFSVERKS
jgi:hypothetical protein